ncbi:MAG: DnaB-like helicase N-terminal domain-containing protein, partial [Gemmatimonadaceae bacterium]|nr:DnaB-like helicase N-terminal domain-containing protein [Gemmatimonadaceae bacterium]
MNATAIPTNHDEAERAVLGALMLQPDRICDVRATLMEDDFATSRHRLVWRALCDLDDRRVPVDMLTLTETLRAAGTLDSVGGKEMLIELGLAVTSTSHVVQHARCVADASGLRRLNALVDRVKTAVPDVGVGT